MYNSCHLCKQILSSQITYTRCTLCGVVYCARDRCTKRLNEPWESFVAHLAEGNGCVHCLEDGVRCPNSNCMAKRRSAPKSGAVEPPRPALSALRTKRKRTADEEDPAFVPSAEVAPRKTLRRNKQPAAPIQTRSSKSTLSSASEFDGDDDDIEDDESMDPLMMLARQAASEPTPLSMTRQAPRPSSSPSPQSLRSEASITSPTVSPTPSPLSLSSRPKDAMSWSTEHVVQWMHEVGMPQTTSIAIQLSLTGESLMSLSAQSCRELNLDISDHDLTQLSFCINKLRSENMDMAGPSSSRMVKSWNSALPSPESLSRDIQLPTPLIGQRNLNLMQLRPPISGLSSPLFITPSSASSSPPLFPTTMRRDF